MIENYLTVKESYELLRKGETTPVELTNLFLGKIEELNKEINAFLTLNKLDSINQAERATKLINDQEPCWLTGVPYAVKDSFLTKNLRTTAGSKVLDNFVPPYNSTAVERLNSVYAVNLGKTNMDEFGMGSSTENSSFGVTKNPWDKTRVSGGSSGGSAAAVAADMCVFALAEDTGGSIRQPASFCGIVGLKPTYGRVSRYGLIALGSSLDHVGTMTKTVLDAGLVLNIIAGFDPKDSTSAKIPLPNFVENIEKGVKGLKIGIPVEFFGEGLGAGVKEVVEKAVKRLEALGAEINEVSLPSSSLALPVYYLIMPSEASSNLARYDGIRFGGKREAFGDEVKRRIMLGTYALSSGYYDEYFLKAAKVRTLIIKEFDNALSTEENGVDVLIGPTTPSTAFKVGEKVSDPLQMYLSDVYTIPANLTGLPAISVPVGFDKELPVGLQIIGRKWEEETILRVAHTLEQDLKIQKKPKLITA